MRCGVVRCCSSIPSRAPFPLHVATLRARRVVITGVGAVSPLGLNAHDSWESLLAGRTGLQPFADPELAQFPTKMAAQVPRWDEETQTGFSTESVLEKAEMYVLGAHASDFVGFALSSAAEALDQAALLNNSSSAVVLDANRAGVAFGSGLGTLSAIAALNETLQGKKLAKVPKRVGYHAVSPFSVPRVLLNMASGFVSLRFTLRGPQLAPTTACASGLQAIGEAFHLVRHGHADVMVAGGTESCLHPVSVASFCRMKALSSRSGVCASSPFDENRDGFVIGEGASALILEEREQALARQAPILAEVVGFGLSGDAHHVTAPPSDGDGALRAMQAAVWDAVAQARDQPTDSVLHTLLKLDTSIPQAELVAAALDGIDCVNAHATSTPKGDEAECAAIRSLLGPSAHRTAVTSNKGAIGHTLGAAGALETTFAVLGLHNQITPPTANLVTPASGCEGLNHVKEVPLEHENRLCLKNSFGFGGTNASLLLARTV